MSEWVERLTDVLSEPRISYSRSYFKAGEIDNSAVVITVARVSDEEYDDLANNRADYKAAVVPV